MKRISGIYKVSKANDRQQYYCFRYLLDDGTEALFLNKLDEGDPGDGWKNYLAMIANASDIFQILDGPFKPEQFREWAIAYEAEYHFPVSELLFG